MEIVISIVAKVAEYTIAPIGRQLGYIFLYNKNINDLKVQCQDLIDVRDRVQHLVDEARSNAYEIESDVLTWLAKVDALTTQPIMFKENESESNKDSNPSCFNFVQRHQQSRKTKKIITEISEIIEKRKMFDKIGHPIPLSSIGSSTMPENYQFLESRTLMVKQIKDALANPNVNKVGVYGMGGVGKTTLLNEVQKLVMEAKLFDQVIKVTIGQTLDVEHIQAQMGDELRLGLKQKVDSKEGRAALLRNKLEMGNNILIMLDDLWDGLDLVDVGIPCRSISNKRGCKIMITSRNVLTNDMDIDESFQLEVLSEEESWKFFMSIIGKFDDTCIEPVGRKVAKKCGGLPIALTTVAKALKGKVHHIWKDALKQLENPIEVNIKGVNNLVYYSLKLSYDYIKSREAQSLFLLCSVFPDDYEISVKKLQMYAMGMGLLNEVNTWDQARNRVIKLVDDLISSSLLLKSNLKDKYVKMHDVVRDIAIHIAWSEEANMRALTFGYKQSEWPEQHRCGSFKAIFGNLTNFHYLPQNLEFRNLGLLILRDGYSNTELQISNTFFEGMEKLTILDLSFMCFQELRISLTHTLVENLQIFCMKNCNAAEIDIIGELKKLQVLRIKDCPVAHLPTTMSKLTELKVLEVSHCKDLNVIPPNIFSTMTKLEELDLSMSFKRWGEEVSYKNKLIKNVTLGELKYLPHLITLKLDILDERMLQDLLLLENLKLEHFCVHVGGIDYFGRQPEFSRTLALKIGSKADLIIDRVFGTLWQRCECLSIEATSEALANLRFKSNENGLPSLSQENSENDTPFFDEEVAFSELKKLKIVGGNNLKRVWNDHGLIANSFCKLQTIEFSNFNSLRYIFSTNVVTTLVSLESLSIEACASLERIFEMEEPTLKQKQNAKVMPLKHLYLKKLLNLECVWNKDPSAFLTFPNLQGINIFDCPQLQGNGVFPATFVNYVQNLESLSIKCSKEGVSLQLFSEDKTSKLVFPEIVFPSLRTLELGPMDMSKSLWFRSSSWFPRLECLKLDYDNNEDIIALPPEMNEILFYNIESLFVCFASQLVQLFSENDHTQSERSCSNLKALGLYHLPELTQVWTGSTGVNLMFDNLERLHVLKCGKLKCLVPPSITFFNLRDLEVRWCHKLMNLLSTSMAKSLVRIRVCDCREMTCIFTGEEEEEEEEDEHEIVFSKLEELTLVKLPKLASFHLGKCKLVFPCLKELMVDECPTMKIFSHGTVSTPKLQYLDINQSEVMSPTKHDINNIFHDTWGSEAIRSIRYLFTPENNEEENLEDFIFFQNERMEKELFEDFFLFLR